MGYHLARREIPFSIVDAGPEGGRAWRSRWIRSGRRRELRLPDPSPRGDRGGRPVLPRTDLAVDARSALLGWVGQDAGFLDDRIAGSFDT